MNVNANEDRRVRKTKKVLRDSLAELLTEKSIQNITIRELTDKADVHRSTFYANFVDIYDLYNHVEDTVIDELRDIFLNVHNLDSTQCVALLFQYIYANKQTSRLVLGNYVSTSFLHRVSALFKDLCVAHWRTTYPLNGENDKLEIYAHFLFSGYLGVIRDWVVSDFSQSESELMSIISEIDRNIEHLIEQKFT